MLLLGSFFGLKELFPVKNGFKLPRFLVIFFENAQNLDDANAPVNSSCAHTPPPPSGLRYCGAFAPLVSPGGGAFANFALLGPPGICQPRGH